MIAEGLDTLKDMAHDMNEVSYLIVFIFSPLCVCVCAQILVSEFLFLCHFVQNTGTG